MRYSMKIQAHEIFGFASVAIFVDAHPHDLSKDVQRVLTKHLDAHHDSDLDPQDWARDVLVALAEQL